MKLFCELTDKYAKKPFLATIGTLNEKYSPIIFGHHIYSFLYEYLLQNRGKIDSVEIISPKNNKTEKLFTASLKSYSPDLEDYKSVSEIVEWFPKEKQMEDEQAKKMATDLIQNSKFVDGDVIVSGDYLIFLPLSDDKIERLILTSSSIDFKVYTNSKTAKLSNGKLIKLDSNSVKNVYGRIGGLKKRYKESFDKNIRDAKYYKVVRYLENFNNTYNEELKQAKNDSDERKIYFVGSDNYTAIEGINDLLGEFNYHECNLYESISFPETEDKDVVFLNLTKLFDNTKQNRLSSAIRRSKHRDNIVLQGNNMQLITYFDEYKKVNVPDEDEIRDLISGLFISLLVYNKKYESESRTLYPFVKDLLLNNLLADSNNTKALFNSIKDFDKLNKDDLLSNISFWSVFLDRYKSKLEEIDKLKEDLISQNIEPVVAFNPIPPYQFIRRKDNTFKIIFDGEVVTLPQTNLVGLLYIHRLLLSNGGEIKVEKLYALQNKVFENSDEEKFEVDNPNLEDNEGTINTDDISIEKYDQIYISQMVAECQMKDEEITNLEKELKALHLSIEKCEAVFDIDSIEEKDDSLEKIKTHHKDIKRIKLERELIDEIIRKAINKQGQIRNNTNNTTAKNYRAVRNAIKTTLEIIEKYNPALFNYLNEAVKYVDGNYTYRYIRIPDIDWILHE